MSLKQNKYIRDVYRGISDFKKGYQPGNYQGMRRVICRFQQFAECVKKWFLSGKECASG